MFKHLIFVFVLFCLSACGHTGKEHASFIKHAKNSQFFLAEQIAAKDDFYKDTSSLLVRYFELGSLHYLKGEYYQALQNFDKAQKLSKELYTKSVSKSVLADVAGDGLIPYDGERYELSMLRFYQSLTHYRLYEQGFYEAYTFIDEEEGKKKIEKKELNASEKRLHFNGARAALVGWNSLLTTFTKETKDKEEFHQDMLAKSWGGDFHDVYGTTTDKQISKQLYKDMEKLLKAEYKDYPSYQEEKNKTSFVEYAQHKGKNLFLPKSKKENVNVLLKVGVITPKLPKTVTYQIPIATLLAAGSSNSITSCLGMMLPGQNISFEIPSVKEPEKVKTYSVRILDSQSKEIAKKEMILTAPVSETAYKEFKRIEKGLVAKKGARLGVKYATAAVASCAIYDLNSPFTMLAAIASFLASSAIIEKSEYADVRYWGLLPNAVLQQSFHLSKGKYTLEVQEGKKTIHKQGFDVLESNPIVLDITLPQY